MRVGLGYDIHPFAGGRALVLGGVALDGPGLAGHSDADVIVHAVADALLGPVGLPDLGSLFPESDERFEGAASIELLHEVARRVADAGWRVENVDVVVAADRPALASHLTKMCANVSGALRPAGEVHVSITPKHAEGLDAVGRAEGIAAWAVALLERVA